MFSHHQLRIHSKFDSGAMGNRAQLVPIHSGNGILQSVVPSLVILFKAMQRGRTAPSYSRRRMQKQLTQNAARRSWELRGDLAAFLSSFPASMSRRIHSRAPWCSRCSGVHAGWCDFNGLGIAAAAWFSEKFQLSTAVPRGASRLLRRGWFKKPSGTPADFADCREELISHGR